MIHIKIKIKNIKKSKRLDLNIKNFIKKYSRNKIINLIKNKYVKINNKIITKPSKKIKNKDIIIIKYKKKKRYIPSKISLNIVYEDKYLIIINKKNNIIVHPGAGNTKNTILNSIIYYYPKIYKKIPRCGIIHRLDKNTTGLLIISKKIEVYNKLINYMKKRKISRIYKTIVFGKINKNGIINIPISRNKYKRTIMSVNKKGKKAITYYKIIKKFSFCTFIKVILCTGRTHQIRVHMNYINHPIIGEKIYTNKNIKKYKIPYNVKKKIKKLNRQALHAYLIKFKHPINKKKIKIKIKLPKDIKKLLDEIKKTKINN